MELHSPAVAYEGSRVRLHALIEASQALNASLDLPTLLRRILDLATLHVGADRGALFRVDPGRGGLVASIFHGDELSEIHVEAGVGLAGEVALTGRPILIADAYADTRFDRSIDKRTGYRTRSVLVVPLKLRDGEIVGALQVLNKLEGEFDADDEAFLEAFGAQAAVALETSRLVDERVRAERLAAVGQVVAQLVHDLRNPLSGVQGYADLVEQGPPPDLLARCTGGLRRQARRMDHMVRSILRYVRGEQPFLFAKCDLDELLEEAVADLRAAHNDTDVEVVFEAAQLGTARVDPMALRRALDNLGRNAVEAMDGRGTLTLEGELRGEEVAIVVSDTGQGLRDEERARLFEAFATRGKPEGTGLGLHVVKETVDGHGGRIEIESVPGEGSTFRMILPVGGPPEA